MLTATEADRYARQLLVTGIGAHGQARLLAARVEVPAGGLAAEALRLYLGAAGVTVLAPGRRDPTASLYVGAAEAALPTDRLLLGAVGFATSDGGPCGLCLAAELQGVAPPGAVAPAVALAAGALAAAHVVLALVGGAPAGPRVSLAWPEARSYAPARRAGCGCG